MAPIFANKRRLNEVGIVRPTTKNNGRIGQFMDGFTQHSAAIEWNFGVGWFQFSLKIYLIFFFK
jgi:hypothetical protein